MTIRVSNGLRASILGPYGLSAMMDYGVIEIYSGTQPVSASNQPTGTLLAKVTNNGDTFTPNTITGALHIVQADGGGLTKSGVWRMIGITTGVAGWWRWKWNQPDDDSNSLYYPRMDGAVGESLTLENVNITAVTDVEIVGFHVNILE
jgi:hypothetical protein